MKSDLVLDDDVILESVTEYPGIKPICLQKKRANTIGCVP